jgi:hypothetical protein
MMTVQGRSVFSMKAHDAVKLTVRRAADAGSQAVAMAPMLSLPLAWDIERLSGAPA